MKRVFPVVVLLAVCSVFGTAQATKTSSVEEPAIRSAELTMMTAAFSADSKSFADVCDPDYRTVNEDGSAGDLHDVLIEMKVSPLKPGPTPPELSEPLIRVVGESAFVSGRVKIVTDKNVPLDLRYLEVWTKRNGSWKLVQWQATRVTPEGIAREKIYKTAK